jgi:antitoxin (DNA-binding transcriptional repressor) of toxin-antitoxin stability system
MIRTNISDLKNRLSHYLRLVRAGEVVEILERKVPLARIEAVSGLQDKKSGNGWLQRMVELGVITAPKSKASRSVFGRMDEVVSEGGQNTGALNALKREREDGR